ncbi:ribonuclease TUDOR 1-like [Panicum hallii]|uniref:ribonuclease TUDOR 1-like n=1 Tax=Panicum hallii TaxID=206008 RepID=UPI000DF4E721|nr:ribonuclease TUDOR 1-like [Panicum hallii]
MREGDICSAKHAAEIKEEALPNTRTEAAPESGGRGTVSSAMAASGWIMGKVKAVPSGDTLVIMGSAKAEMLPPEKSITLSSIIAPRLASRHGTDEPFAWDSREFLRKLCIGQDVKFKVDYIIAASGREFGRVYLAGDQNIAGLVVAQGFAKVKEQRQKGETSPYVTELLRLEEIARNQGSGCWTKEPGAAEASVRILSSSTIGEANPSGTKGFVAEMKGKALEAIVEQVRDGSTIRVYLIPSFSFVQVYVAGVQAPSMGRRLPSAVAPKEVANNIDVNGKASREAQAPPILGTLQKPVASAVTYSEIPPDRFGKEAKHFTETKVLNREVRIILEGTDSFNNMFASVYYSDGNTAKDLALELVENGFAKYMEWSANMLGAETKRKLKNAELQAKKEQLRIWTGYQLPVTNTTPIHNQKFTGKVIEVVNGYCIIVADDILPAGSPLAERRVNLSSIRPSKSVDSLGESKTIEHFARAAKEFLRTRLIGKQVHVSMEYSRRINISNGQVAADKTNLVDTRTLDYGSVFLPSQVGSSGNLLGANVAELLLSRGFADITRHRDYEERSHHYDALLEAYSRAEKVKKGYHAKKNYPVTHMNDLTTVPAKKARDFFHLLQRNRRHSAVVEYIFSGHRFKLTIPNETSTIAFSFSCVRCPGKNEPYSDDAIALMRRTILQRDVEIEIEAVDRTGTFLGSLWESKNNMASVLLEAGLAKLSSFGIDRISDAQTLIRAEKYAQQKKLKVWENYNEAEGIPQRSLTGQNGKQTFKVIVTEVIGGGKFYAQIVGDRRLDNIRQELASMKFNDASEIVPFNPTKGDVVLAQFTLDNSWNRAMILSEHQGPTEREFEVFYIDYGNQEIVTYSCLRPAPANQSTSLIPPLAKLFRLAFITVPNLTDDLGEQAARYLSMVLLDNEKEFKATVEERGSVGARQEGQGTGEVLIVTLLDEDAESSVNAAMLENGLAQMERKRSNSWDRRGAVKNLEQFQEHAKKERRGIWRLRGTDVPARAQPPSRGFDLIGLIASKTNKTSK